MTTKITQDNEPSIRDRIKELHRQGKSYDEIAQELNVLYQYVRLVIKHDYSLTKSKRS